MKTYDELIAIATANRQQILDLIQQAHRASLADHEPAAVCSIVALSRDRGQIVHTTIDAETRREDLYILTAFAHVRPVDAVALYAEERAALIGDWCLEHGYPAPVQAEDELDDAYWSRLAAWVQSETPASVSDILNDAVRVQLLEEFCADSELDDALSELDDLARGIVRPLPSDDDEVDT